MNNFNRSPSDTEVEQLKKIMPHLDLEVTEQDLNNQVKNFVSQRQKNILGTDATVDNLEEGMRLGGLATLAQIKASLEATKSLTKYLTPPGSKQPKVTRLKDLDEVDAWIYLRDTLKLDMKKYGFHYKRDYFNTIQLLKNKGATLPLTKEALDATVKEESKK